ncbi:MAG: FHA domain-containing protein [Chloroflexi bacterium]|nr:FHA domain-containing protein [Chloroflexota bacterium]
MQVHSNKASDKKEGNISSLVVQSAWDDVQEYALKPGRNILGRLPNSDIKINDDSASRRHAEINYDQQTNTVTIRDLASTNGTFVNRNRINQPVTLQVNDQIRIGQHVIHIGLQEADVINDPDEVRVSTSALSSDVLWESVDRHAVLLFEAARKLNDVPDLETALGEISNMITRAMGAENCLIVMAEQFDQFDEIGISSSIAHQAIDQLSAIIIRDAQADPALGESATLLGVQTSLCVPVLTNNAAVALIYVYKTQSSSRPFDQHDLQLAVGLSHQAALVIQRANQIERLNMLHEMAKASRAHLSPRGILALLLEVITKNSGIDAASVLGFNQDMDGLNYVAASGFNTYVPKGTIQKLEESYAGLAAVERRIISVPVISEARSDFFSSPLRADEKFISYYAVPLVIEEQVKGVLEIFHRTSITPSPKWLDFLETLAGQLAVAVDNAELFESLQRANRELSIAYDATLGGWVKGLELRDEDIEGHTQRVTKLAVRLARAMQINEDELIHIRRGSQLHDIGKMGIPDKILHKPGPLTDEELKIMRMHPVYGYEMLSSIDFLSSAVVIPYYHHEKWDGSGYPGGLKGEAIPLNARIFAVVDVWDALRSDRPYRKAWSHKKALKYIQQETGAHFDPLIVERFVNLVNQETHKEFLDIS